MTTEHHYVDARGQTYVGVELTNAPGHLAYIDQADLDRVRTKYGAASLFLNANGKGQKYVTLADNRTRKGRTVSLARAIMQPERSTYVVYWDGNRMNLRRSNLKLKHLSVHGGHGDRDQAK
jgi:hypothetical protein